MLLFCGCLDQNFESESLARYQATRATTFVGFAPLTKQKKDSKVQAAPRGTPRNGMSMPTGRFTGPMGGRSGGRFTFPGNDRFTQPGGNFSFPKGDRFSFPGSDLGAGRFSAPQGAALRADRFTAPANATNNGRFTWPNNQPQNQLRNPGRFTQPSGRFSYPTEQTGRFTYPSES